MSILNHAVMNQHNQSNNGSEEAVVPSLSRKESRTKFLIFIKILFRLLEESGDELLLEQAKLAVVQCRCNASPQFLEQVVQQELRDLVGDELFSKANKYMAIYHRKQEQRQKEPKTTATQTITPPTIYQPQLPQNISTRGTLLDCNQFTGIYNGFHCQPNNYALLAAELEPS
eukprot:CAMPEP_0176191100 /NCGR_PEP_ID=MMETSP0121_2-20121125/4290_1 /TAXON_ID=160619 /ORGANISM="Kryptoperidinium foliaceum, Strain CCMP 1326" /LENGTH=171 /DNA_ID=CAMNT_0017529763 /DNA_START=72 /DNA_END=583 /DNA_ORIENTATION=-